MADAWTNGIVAGSGSVTVYVMLRDTSDTTGKTGLLYTSITSQYVRDRAAAVAITEDTVAIAGAYTTGGFVEVDATNMPGLYRFDLPDAMFVSGVNGVTLTIKATDVYTYVERFPIVSVGLDTIDTVVDSILVDTGTTLPATLGSPAADISADIAAVKVDTAAVLVDTADMQPKLGSPAADLAADVAAVKVDTAAVLVDTADMQPKIGTPAANLAADIAAVKADTAATRTDAAAVLVDTADMQPKLGAPAADISADIAAVKVDTAATLADTADMQPKLGAPAADLAADIAAVKVDTAATLVDTGTTIPALLPAALVGGRMDANVGAISASTTAADRLEDSAETIIFGTAAAGTLSTTQMTSDVGNADDSLNGRVIIFKEDTTTAALRGVATDVTDFANATGIFTFTAIPTAPVNGDTFVVV